MKQTCKDPHCPLHNSLKTHGRQFKGTVTEAKAQKTATVEWQRLHYIPKYERYEQRKTRVKAHNPECVDAQKGDIVIVKECRPLSKTKHFVVAEKTGKDVTFLAREHLLQQAHVTETKVKPEQSSERHKEDQHESN